MSCTRTKSNDLRDSIRPEIWCKRPRCHISMRQLGDVRCNAILLWVASCNGKRRRRCLLGRHKFVLVAVSLSRAQSRVSTGERARQPPRLLRADFVSKRRKDVIAHLPDRRLCRPGKDSASNSVLRHRCMRTKLMIARQLTPGL